VREFAERDLGFESKGTNLSHILKQARYLFLSMAALVLSACFPVVEKQLIVLSLITGAKWIMADVANQINIFIGQRG